MFKSEDRKTTIVNEMILLHDPLAVRRNSIVQKSCSWYDEKAM